MDSPKHLSSQNRRRGHQHHPRNATRRRYNEPNNNNSSVPTQAVNVDYSSTDSGPAQCGPVGELSTNKQSSTVIPQSEELQNANTCYYSSPRRYARIRPRERDKNWSDEAKKMEIEGGNLQFLGGPESEHADAKAQDDDSLIEESVSSAVLPPEDDNEVEELAKLRCSSEQTEVQAEKEARKRRRCSDYPGLAFGSSIFSSDTMMKFSLIRNELKNLAGNQLKRVSRNWGRNFKF